MKGVPISAICFGAIVLIASVIIVPLAFSLGGIESAAFIFFMLVVSSAMGPVMLLLLGPDQQSLLIILTTGAFIAALWIHFEMKNSRWIILPTIAWCISGSYGFMNEFAKGV